MFGAATFFSGKWSMVNGEWWLSVAHVGRIPFSAEDAQRLFTIYHLLFTNHGSSRAAKMKRRERPELAGRAPFICVADRLVCLGYFVDGAETLMSTLCVVLPPPNSPVRHAKRAAMTTI